MNDDIYEYWHITNIEDTRTPLERVIDKIVESNNIEEVILTNH